MTQEDFRQWLREILADEIAKLEGVPPHLIQEVRDGTHGKHIAAALDAMEIAVDRALGDRHGR